MNIEEVYRRSPTTTTVVEESGKNPIMVEAGKKAAITRRTANHTIEQHTENQSEKIIELFNAIREYIIELDTTIEEAPKKHYIAYKTSQNFVCLQIYKNKISMYLKLNPDDVKPMPKQGRGVREIGHLGTGDFELTIKSIQDFEETKGIIDEASKNIGG